MCGIVGEVASLNSLVNQDLFDALTAIQHRGQDAAGIVTCDGSKLFLRKSTGLVRDVIHKRHMLELTGNMGIGHVRYPTAGTDQKDEAQPFYVNSPYGITLAHNGNLTNAESLREELEKKDKRHLNTESDSELILNVLAQGLHQSQQHEMDENTVFNAVSEVYRRCQGGYAVVAMIAGQGIVAFRDLYGIRPLIYGKRKSASGFDYMVASESVALDALGFEVINDLMPGEALFITQAGNFYKKQCVLPKAYAPCLFEYIYFARPDSVMDKSSVYKVRLRMGKTLAKKIASLYPHHDIDVVIPIPETSRPTAQALAMELNLKYREGFIKNRYIGRTFIMPGQQKRQKSVRQKLNPIPLEFKDKCVLLVDDSIVRGTTCKEIIQMARQAGARKVYFASAAPEVRYPNVYGIDMPTATELIAHNRSHEAICQAIGADWLVYQDLPSVIEAVREGNPEIKQCEVSVFTGEYITGDIDARYMQDLEAKRNDKVRFTKQPKTGENLDIYNQD
ncbi:MAG: amidophosphoribosyltransferase [Gammaproteobacteria bacterium]|jgi:amidophosphoribosyltransferase|nr:amidophosphoribosyltransferase [Gammaproteobacteria bacterium]